MLRAAQSLLFVFSFFILFSCHAEDSHDHSTADADTPALSSYKEGEHYQALKEPLRTDDPSKIEVREFFWYGCSHCYHFEPSLKPWVKKLASDVNFVHTPAVWHSDMELHAKMFYAAKQLGKLDEMHDAFFTAMQVGKLKLNSEAAIAKLFNEHGVDEAAFKKAFNSFGIDSQLKQAQAKANGAKMQGTPELLVNGKYRISAGMAGSQPNMLKVAGFLIEKEREAQK